MTDMSIPKDTSAQNPDLLDYFALLKPRVMRLVVFTAFVGMVVAPGSVNPILGIVALLCIALGAGASGALNMYIDSDIDAVMKRTINRPIPAGKVTRDHALYFGLYLSAISVGLLGLYANWFSALFLAFTIFFYVVIYSMWLKRRTPQNIVIGGAAGAFPPMIGWAVVTGGISFESIMMFMVIFVWTPPHFWALAIFRNEDYTNAHVPMLPVVRGEPHTRLQILVYSVILFATTMITAFSGVGGPVVFTVSLILGAMFVWGAWKMRNRMNASDDGFRVEKRYFALSIIYLFVFFLALLVDAALKSQFAIVAAWPVIGG